VDERSADPGGIPWRWAVKSLIPLGFGLVALHAVAATIRMLLGQPAREAARG
jgi:TRAP-type mannitol/chloroaromatic compound transport system permease small subunit